jgi:hypothetical protein
MKVILAPGGFKRFDAGSVQATSNRLPPVTGMIVVVVLGLGLSTCTIVIVKVIGFAEFPFESVAVQVTTVTPISNTLRGAGLQVATPVPSTISKVVGRSYGIIEPPVFQVPIKMFSCGAITGGVLS